MKKTLVVNTLQVGGATIVSRLLGIVREVLTVKFLGVGVISDAFLTAFKIPNSLRKIFADGALSAAFIPTFVSLVQRGKKHEVNTLMTLSFLIVEGLLIILCMVMFWKAEAVMRVIVPGWYVYPQYHVMSYTGFAWLDGVIQASVMLWQGVGKPTEHVVYAVYYFRLLVTFIVFISSSALLAGALQALGHFFVPAWAPVLFNMVFVAGLFVCMGLHLPVDYLCYIILFGGLLHVIAHVILYFKLDYTFERPDAAAWHNFAIVMKKFFPVFLAMSVMEIYFFINSSIASFLPQGSVTLLYYANRFMGIPLGVFSAAFATILLPHFSRVGVYAPKRLQFYLLESAKLIFWVTVPVTILGSFFAQQVFYTLFLDSKKFTLAHVQEAGHILIAFLVGLFFFSLYKIILNVYYALHETHIPLYVSLVSVVINVILSYSILMPLYGAFGVALAMSIVAAVQTMLSALLLHYYFGFRLYYKQFFLFVVRYMTQLGAVGCAFWLFYRLLVVLIGWLPVWWTTFLLHKIGFWLWVGPLVAAMMVMVYVTRSFFGVRVYFLEDL